MQQKLEAIAELSRLYGSDSMYVFLGGGNTSVKSEDALYIKPSGKALAAMEADYFLKIDRAALRKVFEIQLPPKAADDASAEQRQQIDNVREEIAKNVL